MAKPTAADNLCERMVAWAVDTIYGFPGDGINGILGALRRHQDELRFVQTRHEEMASFMACGHAKFTGQVGACMATSGPGAIHLLNGLYDAKLDHQPVVAIVGQTFVRAMGGDFQQEVNLMQLYSDVASSWSQQVNTPSSVRHIVDRAFRIAQAERTVTCVIVPADVQDMEAVEEQPKATHTVHTGVGWWKPRVVPSADQLHQAADILDDGEKVALLVGAGAMHATDEVLAVADALGAGVAKALLGRRRSPMTSGPWMRAPSSSKSARTSGVTTTTSPSRTTLPSAVRLANSGSLSVHSVPGRDHSRAREGFTRARQRHPSSLLSCTQPSAAGGAATAVGSMGRKGTLTSPTSVADPAPSRPRARARYPTRPA